MKKLYTISYALLITCGSLCAQEVPNMAKPDISAMPKPLSVNVKEESINGNKTPSIKEQKPALKKQKPALKEQKMVNIDLAQETRQQVALLLHTLLANEYALYAKTQKYHWNVQGKFFGSLHMLFQKQYEMLAEIVDQTAERSLALGVPAIGGLQELKNLATIAEENGKNIEDVAMIKQLLVDHEMIIKQLRADISTTATLNDMGTNNFLSDLITKHEKIAWMLRAHLQ